MKLNKIAPLMLALFTLMVFLLIIARHEYHLKHSQSIYVQLLPVDPRSLLQGDYMRLRYDLKFDPQETQDTALIHNQRQVIVLVELDEKRRVIQSHLDLKHQNKDHLQLLKLKNTNNRVAGLYLAANSFMFAEALASCYENAAFAEIRVRANGDAMLADLLNQELQRLNCEAQKSWQEG